MTVDGVLTALVVGSIVLAVLAAAGMVAWQVVRFLGDGLHALFFPTYRRRRQADREEDLARARAAAEEERAYWARVDQEREKYRRAFEDYERRLAEWHECHPTAQRTRNYGGTWTEATDRYGDAHKGLREAWREIIRAHGTDCYEAVCIMPSRRIAAGSSGNAWDLAHDHAKGGAYDYLGPAHKECNQAEALARGVSWDRAPTLGELLDSVSYTGDAYDAARALQEVPEPTPPQLPEWHPDINHEMPF